MKHKHAELIKAKADNMELVKLYKHPLGEKWMKCSNQEPIFSPEFDYFLCLPKHKEACSHWLNGGETEYLSMGDWHSVIQLADSSLEIAFNCLWFRQEGEYRIKPKKVKRWIGVHKSGSTTMARESEDAVNAELLVDTGWSIHEIEIEQ